MLTCKHAFLIRVQNCQVDQMAFSEAGWSGFTLFSEMDNFEFSTTRIKQQTWFQLACSWNCMEHALLLMSLAWATRAIFYKSTVYLVKQNYEININTNFVWKEQKSWADQGRGRVDLGPVYPGNHKAVGFIRNTGLLPFQNHKTT